MGIGRYLRREYIYPPTQLHVLTTGRYGTAGMAASLTDQEATTSASWPANNRAVYYPISIPGYFTVARFLVANGNATGNIDIGLYNGAGTRLMSTGSQTRTGSSVVQYYGVTDQTFPPGHYFLAMVCSTTSGQVMRSANVFVETGGTMQEDLGATTLPSTMTPVVSTPSGAAFFIFGFTQSDTL